MAFVRYIDLTIIRGVASGGRLGRNAPPAFRIQLSNAPTAFENFVFFEHQTEKSTFSGLFSYSIYLKNDITPPPPAF
jgi:hypothetical protein